MYVNLTLMFVSAVSRAEDEYTVPFAFAIDFVLIEGDFVEFVLATALVGPAANVFFADPPVEVVDHESRRSAWVHGSVIVFALLALHTLLLWGLLQKGLVVGGRAGA